MKLSKILLPVDFSKQGTGAVLQAAALVRHFGATLILLHVNPILVPAVTAPGGFSGRIDTGWITALEAQGCKDLDAYHPADLEGLDVRKVVVTGDPAATIVELAHREKPDLILLPTHGYGPFRRFLLGSVTAKVLHDVEVPVWTGTHMLKTSPAVGKRIGKVICAIKLEAAEPALIWARDFAAEFGTELTLVHAVTELEPEDPARIGAGPMSSQAREYIRCLQRKLSMVGEILIEVGDPVKVVRAAATRLDADVVVIGRSLREGVLGRLRPNAYSIVRDAPCPVVSV
jgi:nucleotide-binding universal stress UspA family protein